MRTRTITFNLKVPRWVPTRHQWMKWKRKVRLFVFPPRCGSCECKLPVEFPVYYRYRTGYHLGYPNTLSDFAINTSGKQLCASCLKQYIHQLKLKKGTCELCQTKNTKVIGYHFSKEELTIMFLWHWWNGRDFCLTCVDDLLDSGKVRNAY
jgi:hypothetical protein